MEIKMEKIEIITLVEIVTCYDSYCNRVESVIKRNNPILRIFKKFKFESGKSIGDFVDINGLKIVEGIVPQDTEMLDKAEKIGLGLNLDKNRDNNKNDDIDLEEKIKIQIEILDYAVEAEIISDQDIYEYITEEVDGYQYILHGSVDNL